MNNSCLKNSSQWWNLQKMNIRYVVCQRQKSSVLWSQVVKKGKECYIFITPLHYIVQVQGYAWNMHLKYRKKNTVISLIPSEFGNWWLTIRWLAFLFSWIPIALILSSDTFIIFYKFRDCSTLIDIFPDGHFWELCYYVRHNIQGTKEATSSY